MGGRVCAGAGGFLGKNDGENVNFWEGPLVFEAKTQVGVLERCLKVGKLTKIYVKVAKNGV